MSARLESKVAIVTGGAAGLGFAYARRFVAEGARVVIADVVDPADALKRLDAPGISHGLRADVARFDDCTRVVEETRRRFGRVDVLVNNAAVFATLKPAPLEAIPEAEWDRVMAVNVKGIWNCVGTVVFLASDDSAFMTGQTLVVDGGSVFA